MNMQQPNAVNTAFVRPVMFLRLRHRRGDFLTDSIRL